MKIFSFFLSLCFIAGLSAQTSISYYFGDHDFSSQVPTPESVLGYQVGDHHVSHDLLAHYMYRVAESSDRVVLHEYARSYEQKPLQHLIITHPENHDQLDKIKKNQARLSGKESGSYDKDLPIIIYQGYSVHGNEASGGNAALLYAYYLAASKDPSVIERLRNVVILLDPCYNPDGFNRFASWVNVHRSAELNSDGANREFREVWPGGRTNHYWFDLNRDWLLLQHPESRGRIKAFHEWHPAILTDHHEMGTDRSFFFQPGIASRTYPRTPQVNQDLTRDIARYHEAILDSIQSLYYTGESFDDYYIGKGSTFPDVNGCVGILFEQASSRGHRQESDYGIKSFPFTIKNQLVTSLSTLEASYRLRDELQSFQTEFFAGQESQVKAQAYEVSSKGDDQMLSEFCDILEGHDISYRYTAADKIVIPTAQPAATIIAAMMEERTDFVDSLFYDVSAWTLPHAYNLSMRTVSASSKKFSPKAMDYSQIKSSGYAYSISLANSRSYPMILDLLSRQVRLLLTNQPYENWQSGEQISRGQVIISLEDQPMSDAKLLVLLKELASEHKVAVTPLESGSKETGVNPGSPSHDILTMPSVAMVVGNGVTSYDAGEIWHLFDQRLHHPITLIDVDAVGRTDWDRYNTIILVNGRYPSSLQTALKDWAGSGKKIIAIRGANNWLLGADILDLSIDNSWGRDYGSSDRAYDQRRADSGSEYIGGSIFMTQLDMSHPLNYGYGDDMLPVFKRSTMYLEDTDNPYSTPGHFVDQSLRSGYCPPGFEDELSGRASIVTSGFRGARIISFMENPTFRAYFRGTQRQLVNAILYGEKLAGDTLE